MSINHFKKDMANEKILTEWIRNNFLESHTERYNVVNDADSQHSGVDFIINSKDIFGYNLPYKVDFKAALNYILPIRNEYNKKPNKLPTFAFELSFLNNNNEEREGWLFGEKYKNTEYYILAWIWTDLPPIKNGYYYKVDMNNFTYESIEEVEIMVINKEEIRNYARNYEINEISAITISNDMRLNNSTQIFLDYSPSGKPTYPKLYYSDFLNEKPVNLIIHTSNLEEMAIYHNTITKSCTDNIVSEN